MEQPHGESELSLSALLAHGVHSWEEYSALRLYLDSAAIPDPSRPHDALDEWQVRVRCAEHLVQYTESAGTETVRPKTIHLLYRQLDGLQTHQLAVARVEGNVGLAKQSTVTAEAMNHLVETHRAYFAGYKYAPWQAVVGSMCCTATMEPPSDNPHKFLRELVGQFATKEITDKKVLDVTAKELFENARKLLHPLPGREVSELQVRRAVLLLEIVDYLGLSSRPMQSEQSIRARELLESAKAKLDPPAHQ